MTERDFFDTIKIVVGKGEKKIVLFNRLNQLNRLNRLNWLNRLNRLNRLNQNLYNAIEPFKGLITTWFHDGMTSAKRLTDEYNTYCTSPC
jgi:hypothetical protein